MFGHALWRAFLLIALGILLRSQHTKLTNFTFEDTLTQIGLGYVFLFLLGFVRRVVWLWVIVGVILVGYFTAFALYPLPESADNPGPLGLRGMDWAYQYRASGPLEQEQQYGLGVRYVVSQPVPAESEFRFNRGGTRRSASSRPWRR